MDMKAFVLCNVPECSPQLLQDYVEATVDIDVSQVKVHPDVPHRALILLEDEMEDVESAQQAVSDERLNEQEIRLLPIQQLKCTLYVSNIDPSILSDEVLELYLLSVFADGEDVITTCQLSEDKQTAVVFFRDNEVVERILSADEYVPLPSYSKSYHITIEACYSDFHDKMGILEKAMNVRRKAQVQNLPIFDELGPTANDNGSGNTSIHDVKDSERLEEIDAHGDSLNLSDSFGSERFSKGDGIARSRGTQQMYSCTRGRHSVTRGGQQQWRGPRRGRKGSGRRNKQYQGNKMGLKDNFEELGESDNSTHKFQQPANFFSAFDGQQNFSMQKASFSSSMFPIAGAGAQTPVEEFLPSPKLLPPKSAHAQDMHQQKALAEETEKRKREEQEEQAEIQRLKEELEWYRNKPEETTDELSVTPLQGKILTPFLDSLTGVKAQYYSVQSIVRLSGNKEKVTEGMIHVLEQIQLIKQDSWDLSSGMQDVLKRQKGRNYLDNLVQMQLTEIEICVSDTLLLIASFKTDCLAEAKKVLKKKLNSKKRIEIKAQIPFKKVNYLNVELEKNYLVSILCDDAENVITVEGVEDDVAIAEREIKELLGEYGTVCNKFIVTGVEAAFLNKYMQDDVRMLLKDSKITELTTTNLKFEIVYETPKKTSAEQLEKLQGIKDNISTHRIILKNLFSKQEDCMLFLMGLEEKRKSLEKEHKCYFSLPKTENTLQNKLDLNQVQQTKCPKVNAVKSSPVKSPTHKIDVDAGSGLKLVIKPYGDILLEKADILVCVVGPKVDLRSTRVGMAFNRTSKDLWKKLAAEREANPDASVLVTKGPLTALKCQAICHVILHPWNPLTSATELKNALDTIFSQCSQLQAKSVSFPVVGCGQAFNFPPDHVCQEMLTSFHSFVQTNPNSSLQKVTILAKDPKVFTAFQKSVPKFFGPSTQPSVGAVGGVQPKNDSEDEDASDEESESSDDSDGELEKQTQLHIQSAVPSTGEILLVGMQRMNILWEDIKKSIQNEFVHIAYFNQNLVTYLPKTMRHKIMQEAKQNNVWVERSVHPKTKRPGYIIKGNKDKVEKTRFFIEKEFYELEKVVPKKRIASDEAPKRGTVEFMMYAAKSDELFPSYWKLGQSKSYLKHVKDKFQKLVLSQKKFVVEVDSKTKMAIGNLVKDSWDQSKVGHGQDARGLSHSNISIVKVERIENPKIFETYFHRRKQLFTEAAAHGRVCPNIGKIQSSKGPVITTTKMDPLLKKELYEEINEHYLFHGTKKDALDAIITHGLDPKVSSQNAMFGKGVYGAESSTKSDQYADSWQNRTSNGTELKLIVMRMLLGNTFLVNSNHHSVASKTATKLQRPPCTQCSLDKCTCGKPLYDSVMGDGNWLFREFVVYDNNMCYPEYIVTYKRV